MKVDQQLKERTKNFSASVTLHHPLKPHRLLPAEAPSGINCLMFSVLKPVKMRLKCLKKMGFLFNYCSHVYGQDVNTA